MNNTNLIGLSRQLVLQRELDVVANNVANITTNGFKRRSGTFSEFVMPVANADAAPAGSRSISYVSDRSSVLDLAGGAVEKTGNPLDVAIRGDGFLTVTTPAGERFTRNGALSLNERGDLVTADGYPVLSEQGPLAFTAADGAITIAGDGTVSTAQGIRGKLRIVAFDKPQALANEGKNLFSSRAAARPAGPATRLETGAIERSNVNGVTEIARMIEITRAYASLTQMMQKTDDVRRSALTRLADPTGA